jgi:hypothetical protein
MTGTPLRLFYVDDSGAEVSGFATYSWIEFLVEDWKPGLRQVLDWRKARSWPGRSRGVVFDGLRTDRWDILDSCSASRVAVITFLPAARFLGCR